MRKIFQGNEINNLNKDHKQDSNLHIDNVVYHRNIQLKPKLKVKSIVTYSDIGPALPTADRHLDTPG